MTAATSTPPQTPASIRPTASSRDTATDSIPPRPANRSPINRDRNTTTRHASSNDNKPATYAAATSPWECPTTAAGSTPNDRHTPAKATITANDTG
ncbi:hypothetical protein SVIO_088330 [Streptomyces violaceusniger]|uniref:Uncharacterized protein n=1 Tax=Streptomyces violaceusniger TaxID=68280 RepID=A0A4D4LGE8_STRVO|nr:hypothetical protein SVIO_088330 [Streptomyces violaceusniger]